MFEKYFLEDVRYNLWKIFPNEGSVTGYVNWMKTKYTAIFLRGQIAEMIFQTRSSKKQLPKREETLYLWP